MASSTKNKRRKKKEKRWARKIVPLDWRLEQEQRKGAQIVDTRRECRHCSRKVERSVNYCPYCGSRIV